MGYSLNNIVGGVISLFIAIISIIVFNPMMQMIFGLITTNTIIKATMTLVWWLGIFFVLYFVPIRYVISKVNPSEEEE